MKSETLKKEVFEWIKSIVMAAVLAFIIVTFICQPTRVYGQSMQPTIHDQNLLLVEKVTQRFSGYSRHDIITLNNSAQPENLIKRVIGIKGDHVVIKDGKVFVNGELQNEGYISGTSTEGDIDLVVKENEVFVLGDNRTPGGSKDSRFFGCVNVDEILGKAVFRLLPINEIGTIDKNSK